MTPRVQELFHQVADLPSDGRARYFEEHSVDEDTRREVDALLMFDSGATDFLLRDIRLAASQALPQLEGTGRRCGPYRLLDLIGRGGMGVVYLAERADGEVAQRVAVKLLPPSAGEIQRERFLQERQILASLGHPNIARMLDAGHLEDGQPFLAMEFVDGKAIDVFAAGLGLRQKIALFLKVCAAVGYLHRNLVVHRDLKPGNILVTADGEPKLLDFGIAKILDLATSSTMTGLRMLTPGYASPEQVRGERVSTATDIYSLGAVLYRLLTGNATHEIEDPSGEAWALAVSTQEVTRPSKWVPELRGDLEAILLKALRKEPQERYGTVEQFAEDLAAFLESRPVRARSGNVWYRGRKFLRRYRLPVAATVLVLSSLATGLYVANRQRMTAERRFSQLRQLSKSVIFDLNGELAVLPGALRARRQLVSTATRFLEGLGTDALNDKDLALEVGESYIAIARIQGVPSWNALGQYAEAEESLRKADMFIRSVLATDPHNRRALYQSANIAHDHAVVAYAERRMDRMLAYAPKVVQGFDRLAALGNLTHKEANAATYIYAELAEAFNGLHRFDDAVRYARLGLEVSRTYSSITGPRGEAFSALASSLMNLGDFQGALEAIHEGRNLVEHGTYDEYYRRLIVSSVLLQEGLLLGGDGGVNLNRPLEAADALRQAFDLADGRLKTEPNDYQFLSHVASIGHQLGNVLRDSDPKGALKVYDHSLMRIRQVNDAPARRVEATLLACSSYAARRIHSDADAKARIDAAFRLLRETKDYPVEKINPGSEADVAMRALADHYAETSQPQKALEAYQDLRDKIMASSPRPESDLLNATLISRLDVSLAALLRRAGRPDEAVALEASRLDLWRQWNRKLPGNPFVLRNIAEKPVTLN